MKKIWWKSSSNGTAKVKKSFKKLKVLCVIFTRNVCQDAAERMKKRIFLASLQRKQEQEEAKARKEQEAQARREREKAKEEEKARKKEEQIQRRAAILEQYKLKKAMEEAEREVSLTNQK